MNIQNLSILLPWYFTSCRITELIDIFRRNDHIFRLRGHESKIFLRKQGTELNFSLIRPGGLEKKGGDRHADRRTTKRYYKRSFFSFSYVQMYRNLKTRKIIDIGNYLIKNLT